MLQRIQTIYLLLAFALCLGCLCSPIAHFMTNESMETVDMYNLWLVSEGQHMFYFCPVMMGILVITSAFVFMDIWLYKHRALQMRMASLCMVLLVAWYIAYGIISYLLSAEMPAKTPLYNERSRTSMYLVSPVNWFIRQFQNTIPTDAQVSQ